MVIDSGMYFQFMATGTAASIVGRAIMARLGFDQWNGRYSVLEAIFVSGLSVLPATLLVIYHGPVTLASLFVVMLIAQIAGSWLRWSKGWGFRPRRRA